MFEYVSVLNNDKGQIPGLLRVYNIEVRYNKTLENFWSSDIIVRTTPEEYFSSQDWIDILKSNDCVMTGQLRFKSYAKEVWDMQFADWHYIYVDENGEEY